MCTFLTFAGCISPHVMAHLMYNKIFIRNGLVVINIEVNFSTHIWMGVFGKISFQYDVDHNSFEKGGWFKI